MPTRPGIPKSWVDTDTALTANSDSKIATQKAVKAYVDTVALVESDPVFGASEAASFAVGDAAKLAGIEAGAEVNEVTSANLETRLGGASAPDATELSHVNGVTEAIQTQLDGKVDASFDLAPADQTTDGIPFSGQAGENLAFGEVCYAYFEGNVRKFKKGLGTATTTAPVIAMCVNVGGILDDAFGDFIYSGHVTNAAWNWNTTQAGLLTQLWLSVSSAGAMQQTVPAVAAQIIQNVADVINADTVFFRPERQIATVA